HVAGKFDAHDVIRIDENVVLAAPNDDLVCRFGKAERVGECGDPKLDHDIADVGGKPRLALHPVLIPVEVEVRLADVETEVDDRGRDEQREETPDPACSAARSHHCDCAPWMTSLTILSTACFR